MCGWENGIFNMDALGTFGFMPIHHMITIISTKVKIKGRPDIPVVVSV